MDNNFINICTQQFVFVSSHRSLFQTTNLNTPIICCKRIYQIWMISIRNTLNHIHCYLDAPEEWNHFTEIPLRNKKDLHCTLVTLHVGVDYSQQETHPCLEIYTGWRLFSSDLKYESESEQGNHFKITCRQHTINRAVEENLVNWT